MKIFLAVFLLFSHVLASPAGLWTRRETRLKRLPYLWKRQASFRIEPDTIIGCVAWIQAESGDNCNTLASAARINLNNFLLWNPALARNCNGVRSGYSYCILSSQTAPNPPTPTPTLPTPTPIPPTPIPNPPDNDAPPQTSDFPVSNGRLQCIVPSDRFPNPTVTTGGAALTAAVATACNAIIDTGDAKFLERGLPYTSRVNGIRFELQIKIGGFSVTRTFCQDQLAQIVRGCLIGTDEPDGDGGNTGGCVYTSDGNLQSCIFP